MRARVPMHGRRAAALAVALACAATPAVAADAPAVAADMPAATSNASVAPDPATDAAGAWSHFLANATFSEAWRAYDVLSELAYTWTSVDADACRTHADALQASLRKAPVALALHRAAMLCAEARGDDAGAERELLAFAGLARHALRGMSETADAAPIRVLRQQDAYALVNALGLKSQYEWFEQIHAARTFPIVIAAWDPDRKAERMLRFDWIDVAQRISRDAELRYPSHRDDVADAQIRANAKTHDPASIDHLAWREARQLDAPQDKLDKLRMGVGAGGVQSAHVWLSYCSEANAPAQCGDGFVDAVLPLAEKKHALPLVQLAYAYGEGVGVKRDAAVATQLLDAADHRWSRQGGSVRYARMWFDFHEKQPLPRELVARLERIAAGGNLDARRLLLDDRLRRDPDLRLTEADIALLSSQAMNGAGGGQALLAERAQARKQHADHERHERLAAEAGHAYMQGQRAWRLLYGDGKRDKAVGERWLVESAHGGNAWSARQLAWRAANDGDAVAAERWLLQPARNGDTDAILQIAGLFEAETPGTTGDAKRAVQIYRNLAETDPRARRRLAALAATGRGTPKDVALARQLLLQDAEQGDHQSQAHLGLGLLNGTLGAPDEREGTRWVERAMAGGNGDVAADYGYWLYYRKGTAASRTQALDVWRKASARGDDGVDNNLAWALCTAPFDDIRDPKAGLAIVEKMGATVDMPIHVLDTVAACHAANGNFAEAQRAQAAAIAQIDAALARRAQARAEARKAPAHSAAAKVLAKKANSKVAEAAEVAALDAEEAEAADYRARLALYADGKAYLDPAERRE